MDKHASIQRQRLRRSIAADPGRFAGGSAVSDLLGLLAVEQQLAARQAAGQVPRSIAGEGARSWT